MTLNRGTIIHSLALLIGVLFISFASLLLSPPVSANPSHETIPPVVASNPSPALEIPCQDARDACNSFCKVKMDNFELCQCKVRSAMGDVLAVGKANAILATFPCDD